MKAVMTGLVILGYIVFALFIVGLVSVPAAWILMLLLGALADVSAHPGLALSFWSCYIITVIITLFFGGGVTKNNGR